MQLFSGCWSCRPSFKIQSWDESWSCFRFFPYFQMFSIEFLVHTNSRTSVELWLWSQEEVQVLTPHSITINTAAIRNNATFPKDPPSSAAVQLSEHDCESASHLSFHNYSIIIIFIIIDFFPQSFYTTSWCYNIARLSVIIWSTILNMCTVLIICNTYTYKGLYQDAAIVDCAADDGVVYVFH